MVDASTILIFLHRQVKLSNKNKQHVLAILMPLLSSTNKIKNKLSEKFVQDLHNVSELPLVLIVKGC